MRTDKQMATAAAEFAERWRGRGYERGESQLFWTDLLANVFGVANLPSFIHYEEQVKNMVDATNFIDAHIPSTRVLIEQKSLGKDLRKGNPQGDGSILNPFQQAKKYVANMPVSQHPRWIVTCNFAEFLVYDMEQPNGEPEQILLENLGREYYRLQFLIDAKSEHLSKEMQVSMKAGEIVGRIYDALLETLPDNNDATLLHDINVLCVRLVFCLYAEDAGVFGKRDMFHDYLMRFETHDIRQALIRLFDTLATPIDKRDPFLESELAQFPYVNGGLFSSSATSQKNMRAGLIPPFNDLLRNILLQNASLDFDWSEISPTIFGAVFESTLNPETRRSGGMHYTSIENIHKVIDPLFLNDLREELDEILEEKVERTRQRKLDQYQDKLASLTFLDPACGSGNFLTETYLSLRRLENEVIRERYHGQTMMGAFKNPIKVSIQQFHGIEINDFAVTVATTALWISEAQMLAETERIIKQDIDFLPLKSYTNIREGNALRMDWESIERLPTTPTVYANKTFMTINPSTEGMASEQTISYKELNLVTSGVEYGIKPEQTSIQIHYDYIIGNPPFVGARQMNEEQKQDVVRLFGAKWKNVGNMDYVCCWYRKAYLLLKGKKTRAAFVSTNSICQGEQVANLWQPLMENGLQIDFAHRPFRWDSEASLKAHVHCVIIGFSVDNCHQHEHLIFDHEDVTKATHINAYLMDAPDVFVNSRSRPICDVPEIGIGNKPIDGGNYLFEKDEMEEFIKHEPLAAPYFRKWYGSFEFINRRPRYCLWLGDCTPAELRRMPLCMKRVGNVRQLRLESRSIGTRKLADRPTRFHVENMPDDNYIIVPRVSSEKRQYIPMGFMTPDALASDAIHIIQHATLYHFSILMSNIHMAWMRATGGRLEISYRYSKDIVYNNFPWPKPTETQKARIEQTAQNILDARAKFPDSTLADLYDELTMPYELRKAHKDNDHAVMAAYGFDKKTMTESQYVAELFRLYQELTQ